VSVALLSSAALIVATAGIHSVLGERRVISRIGSIDPAVLHPRLRRMLHFTWHLASVYMVLTAATVAWPGSPRPLVQLIGATYLVLGVIALWKSRGRHVSGPLFTAAGVLALIA
jgi:hypothetical protein